LDQKHLVSIDPDWFVFADNQRQGPKRPCSAIAKQRRIAQIRPGVAQWEPEVVARRWRHRRSDEQRFDCGDTVNAAPVENDRLGKVVD
ncbi:MAG: hypothetical protein WBE54_04230, partial [Bradyrhizobium sp.]